MKKLINYIIFCFILIIFVSYIALNAIEKRPVAIIGAMDVEINEILNNLSKPKTIKHNGFEITTGKIGKHKIVLSKSGVGKVNSAITTQYIIDNYNPKYIINTGIAGSLSDELKAGDVIIARKMVQHDFDVTAFGNPRGYIDNGIEPDKPTFFHSDEKLIEKFKKAIENPTIGTIATGDVFVNDEGLKERIRNDFRADSIDMESAAITQTAERNNVPIIVLRTISDSENNSTDEYTQTKRNSAKLAAISIVEFLKKY